jgi:sigma-B regulation protein RsbU (phosphoserine phosphatase)
MYSIRWQIGVELGFDEEYIEAQHCQLVTGVRPESPAEKAGLKPGVRILKVNGKRFENSNSLGDIWATHQPGDSVELTLQRPNDPAPYVTRAIFRARQPASLEGGFTQHLGQEIINTFPVWFLAVGLAVLFLRVEDQNAWLLALMFGGFTAAPPIPNSFIGLSPSLRAFGMAYRAIFGGLLGALFYMFFAVFPARSMIDRRAPWLKWLGLALGVCVAAPGLGIGDPHAPAVLIRVIGENASNVARLSYNYAFIALGLASLVWTALTAATPEARCKIRVIAWGTLVGVVPAALQRVAADFLGLQAPFMLGVAIVLLLFLFPLSFAYAVVKHRVLEIPVLLRRSARYLLVQRGFTILLSLVSVGVTLVFAMSFARYLEPLTRAAIPGGIVLGMALGAIVVWTTTSVHRRVGKRIDRAFFRSAYDARVILEDLAEKTPTATDRGELARLLEDRLKEALQPSSLVVYLREGSDDRLAASTGGLPQELETISGKLPILANLAERGQPWELPPVEDERTGNGSPFALLHPNCLVPMLGRGGRLAGLLVLGPRLSEGPYSGEDKRLLASVASQAGTALENIRLAEEIAERMEAERRVAREMEIAKEVQARLLPQAPPNLKTLDCAAQCIQARSVGGDYYDFLDFGPERVGFAMADVSGKGVHAALLVATLQAQLRSQSGSGHVDPVQMLEKINSVLWKSTAAEHYATLFFGIYDDSTRQLVYVNCGHNPPLCLRQDGSLRRWVATATVIGLFEHWTCSTGQVELVPGDLLAIFSDGVTEAASGEDEFGERRLIEELRAHRSLPANEIVAAILNRVQQFSRGAQSDDLTLLIARAPLER